MATTTTSTFSGSFITGNFAEDVRQTVGLFTVCAVNAVCFPAIRELTVDFLLDETEDVTSPVLAATTETTMQQLYFQFSCVYGRLALLLPPVCVYLVRQVMPTSRLPISRIVEAFVLVLAIFAVVFPVFWIVARQTTLQHLDKCDARDPQVTTAFNAFYCNARATELCAYKGPSQNQIHLDKLVKVFNGGNAVANDSQELMLDVFLGCRSTLVANKGGVSSLQAAFLKSSNTSDAADEWCGRSILSKTTGSGSFDNDLHSLATSSSPASINDAKFDLFVSAWRSQFVFDAVILTVISVFVLAFCWSWLLVPTARKRGGGGRNALSGSRSRDGDELLHEAKHAFANATARSDGQKAD